MVLTANQRKCWDDYGFVLIEGFFSEDEVNAVQGSVDRTWERRPPNITVDDLMTGKRLRASNVSDEELEHNFKLNDLYLVDEDVRAVVSSERLHGIITELLADESVVINSLNFNQGSEQPDHLDTLYMTPRTDKDLVATWMGLEDTDPDSGPLRYWPGSHIIEPYRFTTGKLHTVPEEMETWADYMATWVDKLGLGDEHFVARRGDLFIWNAFLLHGGSAICNRQLTRKSLVTHYWSRTDCEALGLDLKPVEKGSGLWMERPQQPVPGEEVPSVPAPAAPTPAGKLSLFDRLRSLAWRGDD